MGEGANAMQGTPRRAEEVATTSTNTTFISKSFSLRRTMDLSKARSLARSRSLGTFGRDGSVGSLSMRVPSRDVSDLIRDSFTLSRDLLEELLGDVDGSAIAQAGDSGGRVADDLDAENESLELSSPNNCEINGELSSSPLPTDAILHSGEKNQIEINRSSSLKEKKDKLPGRLDHISYLVHMAVFGILGVFTRYLLQKIFGPSLLKLTGDDSALYLDLPSNILGSFLMGWFGVIFKADIRNVSDHLVIGLTTGYLGSLTTFSGWNMKMLDLSERGHWVFAVGGIVLGMAIVNESIRYGVEIAEVLRRILLNWHSKTSQKTKVMLENLRVNTRERHAVVLLWMILILGALWSLSCVLAKRKIDSVTNGAVLWLACLVGPPGVWFRWYLARLNGRGIGRKGILKWLPMGTLIANILAACIMAALSTINKEVNTKKCAIIVSGIQFGFLGCLSTVSTFVAEVFAMRQSGHILRATAYMLLTIIPSFGFGTLIYSLPVWLKHYN
ncbi:uncharacterized protein LOC120270039 [Dioscorea cayenensis subsp. rotundata]|uniref:Uncharacterized protein LOC120270039 n=1 Tax=Dioscorea cayennensis subsp. rotundata TaxID=55577 RepID=A0AB40C2F8_DIOCR|nr:uncharacterized protein LOC120270039 [Dioscorea cayenensis subsp. rotundata]